MKIIYSATPIQSAGITLTNVLRAHETNDVLLLLSSGSWLNALRHVDQSVITPQTTIGMLDERYTTDPAGNNFAQLTQTDFYHNAGKAGAVFLDSQVRSSESFIVYTDRISHQITQWQRTHPQGSVIVTLGMGADGHTAGIFPSLFSHEDAADTLVFGYDVLPTENQYRQRVTVTPLFLRTHVSAGVALVAGQEKCPTLRAVLKNADIQQLPATLWHMMESVTIVTDCH